MAVPSSPAIRSPTGLSPANPRTRTPRLVRWAARTGLGVLVVILAAAGTGAAYEALASTRDAARHPPPGRLVDVGGYRLHVLCIGEGSPTVLLDAWAGGWSAEWEPVQPALARSTRVCAWDRAGSGWSDLGTHGHTPQAYADEMEALLRAAEIEGPYVLVAASYAGRVARLFTGQHPSDVVGLVMVDAVHEDAVPREDLAAGEQQRTMLAAGNWVLARLGVGRLLGPELVPFVDGPVGYKVPGELRTMISVMSLRPKNLEGNARLAAHQADDDARLRAAGSLGSRPLVVLTSSQLLASQPRWGEGQRQLAALSTDSTTIVAEGSHLIAWEHPDLVIGAVARVVARGSEAWLSWEGVRRTPARAAGR
jgi:pimeloyl-ACP methyl ester carboxylesterase